MCWTLGYALSRGNVEPQVLPAGRSQSAEEAKPAHLRHSGTQPESCSRHPGSEEAHLIQCGRPIWERFLEGVALELILEGQV